VWKIAVGYLLLVLWVYARAEVGARKKSEAPDVKRLAVLTWVLLVLAVGITVWGSGWNCLFWLPAGFLLAGLLQTLFPLRKAWR
jgi:hypothetical protein